MNQLIDSRLLSRMASWPLVVRIIIPQTDLAYAMYYPFFPYSERVRLYEAFVAGNAEFECVLGMATAGYIFECQESCYIGPSESGR